LPSLVEVKKSRRDLEEGELESRLMPNQIQDSYAPLQLLRQQPTIIAGYQRSRKMLLLSRLLLSPAMGSRVHTAIAS